MPRRVDQDEAVTIIARLAAARDAATMFVGIDGPGGAGKSTFARRLAAGVPGAVAVAVDDFSGPNIPEWDWRRCGEQLLAPLLAGRAARYQRWDWDRDQAGEWHEVRPGAVVLIEGVSATRDELAVPWTQTVWVETPPEVRRARAIERDGPQLWTRWVDIWIPSEEAYFRAQDPRARADLIVSGLPGRCQRPVSGSPP